MALGIDYSFARPGGAAIKAAGFSFVCRYLASSASKRITPDEAQDLRNNGLDIVLVFEDYANQALNGFNQGVADAKIALSQANAIGFPSDRPIYFAIDFDEADTPLTNQEIYDYLDGAASVLGHNRVGVYGGYYVVKRELDNNHAVWAWQTLAWSGGQVDPRTHIYQNGNSAFGGGADIDESLKDDFGQWPANGTIEDMAEIIDENASKQLQQSVLARNGLAGRPYSLDGSTGTPWVGMPLTLKFLNDIFTSAEASDWRDADRSDTIHGIQKELDSIPGLQKQVADLTAENEQLKKQKPSTPSTPPKPSTPPSTAQPGNPLITADAIKQLWATVKGWFGKK